MDNDTPICSKCGSEMQEGFVPDNAHGAMLPSRWAEGVPEKSFWTGTKQPDRQVPITTFRCPRCGYLESYAWRS